MNDMMIGERRDRRLLTRLGLSLLFMINFLIVSGCKPSQSATSTTPADNSTSSAPAEMDAGVGTTRSAEGGLPSERGGVDRPLNPEKFGRQ